MSKRQELATAGRVQASIAERIRRDLGAFTPNERRAAHRLLADFPMAGLDTVAGLGEVAGVSAPTVLRMVTKLGFSSYGSFQKALRVELTERLATPLMKGGDAALGNDRFGRFAEATIANIRETAANVARGEFETVVRMLAATNRPAYILGGRFTDSVAGYFGAHLRVLRPNVRHITGGRANWLDQLLDVGKRDVVVLFDIRRYSTDLAAFAERAVGRGATIVLITDQWLSPISRVAAHVLPAHVAVPSIWNSSGALVLIVEAILAALARELGPKVRDRLATIEKLRQD